MFVEEVCLMPPEHVLNVKIRIENRNPWPLYLLHTDGDVPELDLRVYDCNGCEIELFTECVNSIVKYSWLVEIPARSSKSIRLEYVVACNDPVNEGLEVRVRNPFCKSERVERMFSRCNWHQSVGKRKGNVAIRKTWDVAAIKQMKKALLESDGMGGNGIISSARYLTEEGEIGGARGSDPIGGTPR